MEEKTFYVTTAIYYVNDVPHIGNAYEAIMADVLARYHKLKGEGVFFLTGTDENAIKVAAAAAERGLPTQSYADRLSEDFKRVFGDLNVKYDDFIRTTEDRHTSVVEAIFARLLEQGDIYSGHYEGWYCVPDETFFVESDLVDGKCPECGRSVEWVDEETYYFRLSAYGDRLLEYIESHPGFLRPEFRKNEVISFIKQGLRDVSLTRANRGWGIPVPGDPSKVIYVWFDALINYISAIGYLRDEERFNSLWPADVQVVGKDIFVRFHCTFWPAMLMGLGLEPPKVLFGHGFWSIEGEKISKSKGNAISPVKLADELAGQSGARREIAVDAIRYFVAREVPFGVDADFSQSSLVHRFNADLANDLGNLLNRTLSMVNSYFGGIIPHPELVEGADEPTQPHPEPTQPHPEPTQPHPELVEGCREANALKSDVVAAAAEAEAAFTGLEFSRGLEAIWRAVGAGNRYIDDRAPWRLMKEGKREEAATALYCVLEVARAVAIMISPVMPSAARQIWRQLGNPGDFDAVRWADAAVWGKLPSGGKIAGPEPIFPRIETKPRKEIKVEEPEGEIQENIISYDEFKKLDIRIAEIKTAEKVEGADKLLRLTVDAGDGERQIVAGIAQWYSPEALVGKKIVLLANLQPAKIRGVQSRGMLLAADVDGRAIILTPDQDVPPGSRVR